MSKLKQACKDRFRKNYVKWLITRDAKYLNQDGLTDQEAEKIKEEVYNLFYNRKNRSQNRGE